ncbi:MAG: hypothetical protein OXP09_14795 [Gammaproteobacteria bacterium]|nr:hypothetical protein [Gammaproteobacteria bacterium]
MLLIAAGPVAGEPAVSSAGYLRVSSTATALSGSGAAAAVAREAHTIPFFPSASDALGRQGFARIVNLSGSAGTVSIVAFDDGGRRHGPVTLSMDARRTVHFNSVDLEDGEASKGLPEGTGAPSQGDWRLELTSELDINVLSYIRTPGGFVTSMHDVAPNEGNTHRVPFVNPGSNTAQQSLLRLVNPGDSAASVTIRGVDDRGAAGPGGAVTLTLPPRASRTVSAMDLEVGASGLNGSLGDGAGKWRLEVHADSPIMAVSMLSTPTGHLTNLSTDPGGAPSDDRLPAPVVEVTGDREFKFSWEWSGKGGETYAFDYGPRLNGGDWSEDCASISYSQTVEDTVTATYTTNADLAAGTVIEARYRYRNGSSCDSGSPGDWSHVGRTTVAGLAPPDQAAFDARYVGKRVLTDDSAYSLDIVSAGRFRENLGDASYAGNYTYRYVGPDAGEVDLAFDDGDRCAWEVTFEQTTSGTAKYSCNDGTQGTANWRIVDIPAAAGAPDLVVDAKVDDSTPEVGQTFEVSATVRNRGDASSQPTTVRYLRSSDSTISRSDTETGTDSVTGLSPSGRVTEISLYSYSNPATYYFGACVDSVSGESDTGNNCSAGVKVEVIDGGGGGGTDSYCRDGDTIDPGKNCDIYNTSNSFEVESSGRACASGICASRGGRYSVSSGSWRMVADGNSDGSWTIEDVEPEPSD